MKKNYVTCKRSHIYIWRGRALALYRNSKKIEKFPQIFPSIKQNGGFSRLKAGI
jgi:hypothetical protein